jgi:WD40 repeat protein
MTPGRRYASGQKPPDGRTRIATVSSDRTVRVWDTAQGTQLMVLTGHEGPVRGVAWPPDGTRIATGSNDRTVRIWDAPQETGPLVLCEHTQTVAAVAWSPDGTRLASSSTDRTIRIRDGGRGTVQPIPAGRGNQCRIKLRSPGGAALSALRQMADPC